jgi:hypothetical protein
MLSVTAPSTNLILDQRYCRVGSQSSCACACDTSPHYNNSTHSQQQPPFARTGMEETADSPQPLPSTTQHGVASSMFIEVPDQHGVTEVFTTDHLYRTNGDGAAFTDLARSIATSLGIPQPGVLYFEYNRRATSGLGLLGLLRGASDRGLDHVVIDWERSVRVAGRKRSRSPAARDQDGVGGGRQKVGRRSSVGANDEQAGALSHLQEHLPTSRHGSRRSSTSSDLFVREDATRAPITRQVQQGAMAFGAQRSSQVTRQGARPGPFVDDSETDECHDDGDDDSVSFSNNHDSRDETLSIQTAATGSRSESPITSPAKSAAPGQLGRKFNMLLFKQKAASKQKKKAGDEVQGPAEARTSTVQATHTETGPAKTTPAIPTLKTYTSASAPPILSPHAESLFQLAPTEREQMKDCKPYTYRLQKRTLRFPDRWYAEAGKVGPKRDGIYLIMETTWGEQRHGADMCVRCAKRGFECWVLSDKAKDMVMRSWDTCARCRISGRCSFNPKST